MKKITKISMVLLFFAVVAGLSSCELFSGVDGVWQETSFDGFPNLLNEVYTLSNGTGSYTLATFGLGDGFTFTVSGGDITISGGSNEDLIDGTYAYSYSGATMTWQSGAHTYIFTKQ